MKWMKLIFALFAISALFAVAFAQQDADDIIVDEVEDDDTAIQMDAVPEADVEGGAEEDEEPGAPKHYLTDLPDALEALDTYYVLPHYPDMMFPAGEVIDIVVGLQNHDEEKALNITMIGASLNVPQDFSYYVQNYSAFDYNIVLDRNEQTSLLYQFKPDAALEQRDFQVAVTVFYQDSEENVYSTTFFNETIEIGTPLGGLDSRTFFTYVLGVSVVSLVGLVVYRSMSGGSKKSGSKHKALSSSSAEVSEGASDSFDQDVILPGATNKRRSKTPTRKRKN